MDFLGEEMIQAYGLVDLPDQDALDTLEIPVTVDIYKKEKLPARIIVDMTDVMDELYQSFGKTTNVNFIILNWCITDMIMWDRFRFLKM